MGLIMPRNIFEPNFIETDSQNDSVDSNNSDSFDSSDDYDPLGETIQ